MAQLGQHGVQLFDAALGRQGLGLGHQGLGLVQVLMGDDDVHIALNILPQVVQGAQHRPAVAAGIQVGGDCVHRGSPLAAAVRDPGGVPQDEEQHGQQYEQGDADGPHRAASFRRHTTVPCWSTDSKNTS